MKRIWIGSSATPNAHPPSSFARGRKYKAPFLAKASAAQILNTKATQCVLISSMGRTAIHLHATFLQHLLEQTRAGN